MWLASVNFYTLVALKNPKYHKISRWALYCVLFICLLTACVVQRIDDTPYQQTNYYQQTVQAIDNNPPANSPAGKLQVGWAKVNITPPVGAPLAGYGKRLGLRYEEVHDSVWVRTFVFDNGSTEAVIVALDMLITPMTIAAALEKEYEALGLKPEQVYLTATHTHTSFGGWGEKLAGRMMAGTYEDRIVAETTARIVESIRLAQRNKQPARLGYGQTYAPKFVGNRLTGSLAERDTTIRFFKIEQVSGSTAVLTTFAGHATILPSRATKLSRDYPGELVDELEENVDFAAFAAGAVGSQSVLYPYGDTYASTEIVGLQLAGKILKALPGVFLSDSITIAYSRNRLELPEPQWRLSKGLRFAPFLFRGLFGEYPAFVSSMQLGGTTLLGVPADYSGDFLPLLEKQATQQGQHVIVTGFNGGYVGYITPDRHYQLDKYETRAMNFYGPQSGSYFTDILLRVLKQYRSKKGA